MRTSVAALVLALLAGFGVFSPASVPGARAAVTDPKVVIIVGATHEVTPTYRQRADAAYAEAIKYTSNVVRVYSPNATWAKVKSVIQGAAVVIYMGHGNGFPSPYRSSPWPYSQNGFGLNATAGNGDYNNQYYGEYYIGNEIRLAPNAVVLLHHLCYAAGNSEPGNAEPTLSVAKQRADNYAAGFLKAGARAVIADGHMGPEYYIRALFTTRQSVDQLWRKAPNFHNHAFSFASVRSPGYTVQMDPESSGSGYYRAITGNLALQTVDITGAAHAGTDWDPTSFVVPGAAEVDADGASLYGDPGLGGDPSASLPAGTKLRLVDSAGTTGDGSSVYEVSGVETTADGFVSAADLIPRDSTPPQAWSVSAGSGAFSPNGDGRQDLITISGELSETGWWRVRFWRDGTMLWSGSGNGTDIEAAWAGIVDGTPIADGPMAWTLELRDPWGNVGETREGEVAVDTVAPTLTSLALADVALAAVFSPNGDGSYDSLSTTVGSSEPGAVDVTASDAGDAVVRSFSVSAGSGSATATWDGRNGAGVTVADGLYTMRFAPRDRAGNVGPAVARTVGVYGAVSSLKSSVPIFYPQDLDSYAKYSILSFVLARPATVTWQITKLDGTVVRTFWTDRAMTAGTWSVKWYGNTVEGAYLPVGWYVSVVRATDGTVTMTHKTWFVMDAFRVTVSDTTPARGQTITVTAVSAESLSKTPIVYITQPGIAPYAVALTRVSGLTYRATVKLKSSGAGNIVLRVSGYDLGRRWQRVYLTLPLS